MGYLDFLYRQLFVHPPQIPSSASLEGRTVLITGSNGGIGLEAARECVRLNAKYLILAVRTLSKGERAKEDILKSNPGSKTTVEVWALDMESFDSVLSFGDLMNGIPCLDIAILNAGQFKFEWNRTVSGIETSLQVNHLSTALLSLLLLPVLRRSSGTARLTFISSEVHMFTPFKEHKRDKILESLNSKQKLSDPMDYYSVTKLWNVFWALELASKVSGNEVVINLLNPGSVFSGLHRDNKAYQLFDKVVGRSVEEGGRLVIDAAVVQNDSTHGKYLSEAKVVDVSAFVRSQTGSKVQKQLWQETRDMLGQHIPPTRVIEAFDPITLS